MTTQEDLTKKLWERCFGYQARSSKKGMFSARCNLELIRVVKKNIAVMCFRNCKSAKEIYIQAMQIHNIRREFIVYKQCIRHKKTGGKIFFKDIKPNMNPKFEFKGSNTWTI